MIYPRPPVTMTPAAVAAKVIFSQGGLNHLEKHLHRYQYADLPPLYFFIDLLK